MVKYIFKRLGLLIVTFLIITTICFTLVKMLPNPIPISINDSTSAVAAVREAYGYNKPIITQFYIFAKKVITEFDWGVCLTGGPFLQPVGDFIATKLPATIVLNIYTVLWSVPLGIFLGIYAALRKNKWQDHFLSVVTMLFISVPAFVYAFVVQYFLGFKLNWFPIIMKAGTDWFSFDMMYTMGLAIISMSFGSIAFYYRITRAELTETLTSEYVLLARTKGLSKMQATFRHAFRNCLVVVFPIILGEIIGLLFGSLVIERIFAIPGIGDCYVNSILVRDYNIFIAISSFYLVIGLLAGLVVDLSYGIVDPRIRMGGGKNNELS